MAIALEGDFTAAHTDGDNTNVVATDTMKNTAYAFAADHLHGSIEHYAAAWPATSCRVPQVEPGDGQRPRARLAPHRGRRRPGPGRLRPLGGGDPRGDRGRDR